MSKESLKVKEENEIVTIKLWGRFANALTAVLILICGATFVIKLLIPAVLKCFAFVLDSPWNEVFIWTVILGSAALGVVYIISACLEKIIIDKGRNELIFGSIRKQKIKLNSIKNIYFSINDGDYESDGSYRVIIELNTGRRAIIETYSREQTMELIEVLEGNITT